jgi:hypothetical protein
MTPLSALKVGDRVRVLTSPYGNAVVGREAVVDALGHKVGVLAFYKNVPSMAWVNGNRVRCLYFGVNTHVEKIVEENISLGVPSIADDLRLKPQARKVLAHLRAGKSISPLEAQNVYAVYRLAASIYEIKNAGYKIAKVIKQDEAGHKYARYSLAA